MRTEQRWSGLVAGVASRAVRFVSGIAIATACLRHFGSEAWGLAALALATTDLATLLDLSVPELCVFAAARARDETELHQRVGQALWLLLPPTLLGVGVLIALAAVPDLAFAGHDPAFAQLLYACAAGFPFVLLGNSYGAVLQGIGRLREMNYAHGASGLIELVLVLAAVAADRSLVEIQWLRTGGQVLRCALFVLALVRIGVAVPRLRRPQRAELKAMLRYALGYSSTKLLGTAICRANLPIAQAYTTASVLGAYDGVDRLGTVLQRTANPVWDSLFQRLVRAYASEATEAERRTGARDFLAGTSLLMAMSGSATLVTLALAPLLFPLWLGAELAREPMEFAPWVLAAWSLNVTSSMCTAVLAARSRFRVSALVHAAAFATQVLTFVLLGPSDGKLSLLAAPVVGNAVLAVGLAVSGCRAAHVPVGRFALRALALWTPVLLVLALVKLALAPGATASAVIATLVGAAWILVTLWRTDELRALSREFREGLRQPS